MRRIPGHLSRSGRRAFSPMSDPPKPPGTRGLSAHDVVMKCIKQANKLTLEMMDANQEDSYRAGLAKEAITNLTEAFRMLSTKDAPTNSEDT